MVKKISNNNMEAVNNSKLAVIDFNATWCGPCKMLAPVLDGLSEEVSDVDFYACDVDENGSLAQKFMITNIPALILVKDGKEVARTVGFQPKESLVNFIESNR